MKVLVVGSGGREHTLAWRIARDATVDRLCCAPGNAGTAEIGENIDIQADDVDALIDFARLQGFDLTVVGPEAPLVGGIADRFRTEGLPIVGPGAAGAQLEGSKVFAKRFMLRHGIPTAECRFAHTAEEGEGIIREEPFGYPVVVKADGLAAGKGVLICRDRREALQSVDSVMRRREFGAAGERVVIERFMPGQEASFMVLTDGQTILPLEPSRDHKAACDGDKGPNTGGMGAYSVSGLLDGPTRRRILDEIVRPAVRGLAQEGHSFSGVLYAGLMLSDEGPRTLEFNVRLGDPETQVVLPRLAGNFTDTLLKLAEGRLAEVEPQWDPRAAVTVVLAAPGYPGNYPKGLKISGVALAAERDDTYVFHAGTARRNGDLVTNGGRVLAVTALAPSLPAAAMKAYEGVNKIHFDGMHYRRDIAAAK